MFPTLCDVCYDGEGGPLSKFEHYRLSRTVSPSSVVPVNILAPYLSTGPLNSRCSPSPDLIGRHNSVGAGARALVTPSPTRRSKTTIGHYYDGTDRPSPSPYSSAFGMYSEDRFLQSRAKTIRPELHRTQEENEDSDGDKLIWVDKLKKWVTEDSDNLPYFSFVNTASLQSRGSSRYPSNREKPSAQDRERRKSEKSTASIDLSEQCQEKSPTQDPEKRKSQRARRGFLPPRKPPSKPPTSFISVARRTEQRPSKTILRQKTQGSGDPHSSSRISHGKLSAAGSHRVHFIDEGNEKAGSDENDFQNHLEIQTEKSLELASLDDGSVSDQQSRTDSAFESANESRLSLTELEDIADGRDSRDQQFDSEVTDLEGHVSTDDSKSMTEDKNGTNSKRRRSKDMHNNIFNSDVNNSTILAMKTSDAGSSSNNKDGKARRFKGDPFRRASGGGGDNFDRKGDLSHDSLKRLDDVDAPRRDGNSTNTEGSAESDLSILVTKEIASVRLDHPPNLELVVDSESKGAVAATRTSKPIRRQRQLRNAVHRFPTPVKPAPQVGPQSKTSNWLFSEDLTEEPEPDEGVQIELDEPKVFEAPPLPVYRTPTPPRTPTPEEPTRETEIPLIRKRRPPPKPRWGPKRRDQSYLNSLKDAERREKARQLVSKMWVKDRTKTKGECAVKDAPRFEQYGFLAKYCILNRTSVEMYRRTFDAVDDDQKGWLTYQETLIGLRGVNQKLKDAEEKYLYRVLELCGYNVRRGADFKLFAVLSALSQKITSLDGWMRNLIGRMDFKMLEMKMFLCKHLWECNVDRDTNRITIEQLCVELRAGGVSEKHIDEVRQRLGWMRALDLLDFLTYIPLFIMLHTSIVDNPLDMSRTK